MENMVADYKVDIFELLAALDKNDKTFFDNLSEDEQKSVPMKVVMRWLSAVQDNTNMSDYYTLMVNEIVNIGFWDLSDHPHLQYLLMSLVGTGKKMRHVWIPQSKNHGKCTKAMEIIDRRYPNARPYEVDILLQDHDSIVQLAIEYGYDKKFVASLRKELKSR